MADEHMGPAQITPKSANDYLEVMSKAVFQSGISWRVIEAKWPSTREAEAIAGNAARMLELEAEHGSFKEYLRSCGSFDETVRSLRQNFKFLGESGCYFFLWVVKEPVPPYEEWSAARNQPAPRSTSRAPRSAAASESLGRARRR